MSKRTKPDWICHSCGTKFCNRPPSPGATYSLGKCQCCGLENVPCTEPRDYGGFEVWPLPREIDPLPIPETLDDLIEPVIDSFDFEKVYEMMKAVNWQWVGTAGETFACPSIDRMKEVSKNLLVSVVKNKRYTSMGTGGFLVEKIINEQDSLDNGLILRFIADSSELYFGDFHENWPSS
jgi:hypothetical protein